MSYDTERAEDTRQPVIVCEIDLDRCAEVFGTAPCLAVAGTGLECYNTRATCQDPDNFNNTDTLTLKFSDTLIPGEAVFPCLESADLAPTIIDPDKGISIRASIKVRFKDFTHHDRGTDPYQGTRLYDAASQGTFFGKLFARNKHYQGRPLRILSGYISAGGFSWSDFTTRNYVIDKITGPDSAGNVEIVAKDILKLADDDRAEAPAASTGLLTGDITDSATSLTVTSGTETEYDESEYVRVGDEIILAPAANRSSNVFSNLSRGQFGSTAAAHSTGDQAQACKHLDADNVVDVVADLLENYAGISASYIPSTDWTTEKNAWFPSATITTLITKPEGVASLINDLARQFYFQIWWNEIDQEIVFSAIRPPDNSVAIPTLTDRDNIIADSVKVDDGEANRLTRVLVYYNPRTPLETSDQEDYEALQVSIAASEESADLYGDIRRRVIMGRFIGSASIALQTAGRLLSRHRTAPRKMRLMVDAKDADKWTGELVDVVSRSIQQSDGSEYTFRGQIVSVRELTAPLPGHQFEWNLLESNYGGTGVRYGYIGPGTLSDYDVESDANKAAYGFIAPDSGIFTDDDEPAYRII